MTKLTPKQKCFVDEYLIDLNATQAAIRAKYSKKTAHSQGPRLLENVEVARAISLAMKAREDRAIITQDQVLKEYAKLVLSDVRGFYSEDGQLRAVADLPDDLAAAVSGVEVVTKAIPTGDGPADIEHTHKIKLWDKKGALDSVARHLGMFDKDTLHHTGDFGFNVHPHKDG